MLRAIIFDFNGVIIDDEPLHLELFRRVLAEEGLELTEQDYYDKYLGYDDRGCFLAALADAGRAQLAANAAFINELIARKADYYRRAIDQRDLLFPGVVGFVQAAAARFPLAIVSGALRQEIELVLSRAGIRHCFRAVVAAEDVSQCKPNPEGYLKALAVLNAHSAQAIALQPGECLVIEDSVAGIAAAHGAGMRCLAVTNSYPASELAEADWVVSSLSDCSPEILLANLKWDREGQR